MNGILDRENKIKKVQELIENGDREGVLLYATSIETLAKLFNNQEISASNVGHLEYVANLPKSNFHYFFMPVMKNIALLEKGDEIIERLEEELGKDEDIEKLIEKSAGSYSGFQSYSERFKSLTGLKVDRKALSYLLHRYNPDAFFEMAKNNPSSIMFDLGELAIELPYIQADIDLLESHYEGKIDELLIAIKSAFQHKGVVIYYKESIQDKGTISLGEEDEVDVILSTNQTLTLDDIAGVKFLSEQDRISFMQMIGT